MLIMNTVRTIPPITTSSLVGWRAFCHKWYLYLVLLLSTPYDVTYRHWYLVSLVHSHQWGVTALNRVDHVTSATYCKLSYCTNIMAVSWLTSQPGIRRHLLYYQVDFLLNKFTWQLKFPIIAIMIGIKNYDCSLDIIMLLLQYLTANHVCIVKYNSTKQNYCMKMCLTSKTTEDLYIIMCIFTCVVL